jgi:hypothetical protein
MSQTPGGQQANAPKPIPLWTAINVITVLLVLGLIAWASALQLRNKDLEKKVAAVQKTAEAAAKAKPALQPHKGQAVAPTAVPVARARKRRRPTTAATAPATQPTTGKSPVIQPAKLVSDQELARVEQLHTATVRRHEQGTATLLDVLRAKRLLNRAKFLHGDVTREQYGQESDKLLAEMAAKLTAMEQAGLAEPGTILEFYERMLLERN